MPKLHRLSGREIIRILQGLGFEVVRIRGSHHQMQRVIDGEEQTISVLLHGNKPLATGTLRSIYRQACLYMAESDVQKHFYTD